MLTLWDRENRGTFLTRLQDAIKYMGTGSQGTVRVNADDLKILLERHDSMDNTLREQRIDLDLRSQPEIQNMPESIEKELYIIHNKSTFFK